MSQYTMKKRLFLEFSSYCLFLLKLLSHLLGSGCLVMLQTHLLFGSESQGLPVLLAVFGERGEAPCVVDEARI